MRIRKLLALTLSITVAIMAADRIRRRKTEAKNEEL